MCLIAIVVADVKVAAADWKLLIQIVLFAKFMKERRMRKICLMAVVCLVTAAFAMPAEARVRAGSLNCRSGTTVGMILGSQTNLNCVFIASGTNRRYPYTGTMTRVGVDIGITSGARFVWAVFAPTSHVGPGALAGDFVGASGSASVGVGAGANVLIGGSIKPSPCNRCRSRASGVSTWRPVWPVCGFANAQYEIGPAAMRAFANFRKAAPRAPFFCCGRTVRPGSAGSRSEPCCLAAPARDRS